jgi:hypothetical protein
VRWPGCSRSSPSSSRSVTGRFKTDLLYSR